MNGVLKIVIVNKDAKLTDVEIAAASAALNRQAAEDIGPAWDVEVYVRCATPATPPQNDEMVLELHDQPPATVEGALGFHDRKYLYVFVGLCAQDGTSWTSCASHEIAETAVDPRLRRGVQDVRGTWWAQEVSDACETVTYEIDGIEVSDFCLPAWFEPELDTDDKPVAGQQYDFCKACTAPFQILPGGYGQTWSETHGWSQLAPNGVSAYRAKMTELDLSRHARRARHAA